MFKHRFNRTAFLSSTILELQTLGKLCHVEAEGNERFKINWVDGLITRLPETKIIDWGKYNETSQVDIIKVKHHLSLAFQGIDYAHNPSLVQRAIIARLIEIRAGSSNKPLPIALLDEVKLEANELLVCEQLWKLYQVKQILTEAMELINDI